MKTTYPSNPGASLLLADIGTDLHFVERDTFLGYAVRESLSKSLPVKQIVGELSDQIQDNREGVARCIGIKLVEKIEKYKKLAV